MSLNDPRDPRSLSARFRAKRAVLLKKAMLQSGRRVLDLGGTADYWRRIGLDFLSGNGFQITILNFHESELGEGPFKMLVGDACGVDRPDMEFDFVHSNSVIEHVGSWTRMQMFAREVRRLAPNYYVQTPNWWFPIEPHFYKVPMFHWLPEATRAFLLRRFAIAHAGRIPSRERAVEVVRGTALLRPAQMRELFPDAELVHEKLAGLAKSLIMLRV